MVPDHFWLAALALIPIALIAAAAGAASPSVSSKSFSMMGFSVTKDGRDFRVNYVPSAKNTPPKPELQTPITATGSLEIAREQGAHPFFKKTGLATEVQTGDAQPDDDRRHDQARPLRPRMGRFHTGLPALIPQ